MEVAAMSDAPSPLQLTRHIDAPAEDVWELWTTPAGIESWWAPDGFTVSVSQLELAVGGTLVYTMTATGAEQVAFMEGAGLPLASESRKRFTDVGRPSRLAYATLADFIPGVEPYETMTWVTLEAAEAGTQVTMTIEPMHDDVWTERLVAGRENELANLAAVTARRSR
jgi:uncharacterized protein YndB with AHSA1/START domain